MTTEKVEFKSKRHFVTTNYAQFTHLIGNRPVEQSRVNVIKQSILNSRWLGTALTCNSNYVVFDGQHRLAAIQQLVEEGLLPLTPLEWTVDNSLTLADIIRMNMYQKKWSTTNYVDSQIVQGNSNYSFLKEVAKTYNIPISTVLYLSQGVNPTTTSLNTFKQGEFIIENKEKLLQYAGWLHDVKPYFKWYNTRSFILALRFFFEHPKFKIEDLLHKASLNRDKLFHCTSIEQYKQMLQNLYNYKRADKISFIK